jgi:hypothetical protein
MLAGLGRKGNKWEGILEDCEVGVTQRVHSSFQIFILCAYNN